MSWIIKVFKESFNFRGRARRREYWAFHCFCLTVFAAVLAQHYFVRDAETTALLVKICACVLFIPSLAVSVRRMHDIGKSGWAVLSESVPMGVVILPLWYAKDSEMGDNEWGPNPKGVDFEYKKNPRR